MISSDAVSHLVNTVRSADEIITKKDKTKVTNQKNVDNMRKRVRLEKKETYFGFKAEGLMVDERIDNNKVVVGVGEKGHKRSTKKKQENCAVIGYPGEVLMVTWLYRMDQ